MNAIVNIAAYKFVDLSDLPSLRNELRAVCREAKLKGTILLSPEGINLFVAGGRAEVDRLLHFLRSRPAFVDLEVKESLSDEQPFNRMLVKIKQEIIAFRVDGIAPARHTSPRISPRELKRWLDEGRPVTLLDTRNNFEIEAGTFENAIAIGVDQFTDFPDAARQLSAEMKSQPVVTFCTGGIRCEKAAPMLELEGFTEVYQLDGGILKYFEECGGDHYRGDCFVFDKRVAVDSQLRPSGLGQCFACQATLSADDQQSPLFVEGVSCPYCYVDASHSWEETLKQRRAALRTAASPLPGSQPYENERPLRVAQRHDGMTAIDFVSSLHTQLDRSQWVEEFSCGRLKRRDEALAADTPVAAGDRLLHATPGMIEPAVNAAIELLYEDEAIVVVNKPAPLPMHPCGRFNRNTLIYLLRSVFEPLQLRPVHRLDADTSGVVVLAKTRKIAALLQPQFEQGEVAKRYLALVRGTVLADQWSCELPITSQPGAGGVRTVDADGLASRTDFRVLARRESGETLLLAIPVTGRTNQIRIHLWAGGTPIVGDPIYLPGGELGPPRSLAIDDPPLRLHALSIEFRHPLTDDRIAFEAPLPDWAKLS